MLDALLLHLVSRLNQNREFSKASLSLSLNSENCIYSGFAEEGESAEREDGVSREEMLRGEILQLSTELCEV